MMMSLSPTTPEARPKRRRFALTPECTPPNLTYMDRQFKTVKILGEGCYGVVNEVECRFSKEKFAIKIFKVDKLKNKSGLNYDRRNLQEVRTHISIPSHPNLVQFYSSWKENTYLCMQMELCEQSLYDYWKTKRILSQMDIEDVMKDSLNALACLSSLNLVHLDIKPANILRTEQGSYKLADFSVTVNLNKVSVPSDAPLDEKKEWTALKDGRVPHRVTNALAGQLDSMVHSMLREYCARPSAQQLLDALMNADSERSYPETQWENDFHQGNIIAANWENDIHRGAGMAGRLSLSASFERELRENRSPLVRIESPGVIFHTDSTFFELEKPKEQSRFARKSFRPISFNLDG